MKSTQGQLVKKTSSLLVMALSLGTMMNASLVSVTQAKGGDSSSGGGSSSSSSSSSKSESQSNSSKDQTEKIRETATQQSEIAREANKHLLEQNQQVEGLDNNRSRSRGMDSSTGDNSNSISNDGTDAAETINDNNRGEFTDKTKLLEKLNEKVAQAEKKILEKQAQGVDVTAALARLDVAKAAVVAVGAAFDANNLENVKSLAQNVRKLAHFAENQNPHDAVKISENTDKVAKRIAQANRKIADLKALGGDTSTFETALTDISSMLAQAKTLIANGGTDAVTGFALLDTAERQAKAVKDSIENAIFALGGTDLELGDDHRNEVEDVVHNLNDIADIEEGGVGSVARSVATEQHQSAERVSSLVSSVEDRSRIAELLIGPNTDDLQQIENEIADNNQRVDTLNRAKDQVGDKDVRNMLEHQIQSLQQETIKLQNFVTGQIDRGSLFGWFKGFFSRA